MWRCKYRLDDDFHASRKQVLGSDSKSFVGNWDDLSVDVLFSTLVTTAPVEVTLSVSFAWPVGLLTFIGAENPVLAPTTQLGWKSTNNEAEGAVSYSVIFFLQKQHLMSDYKRKKYHILKSKLLYTLTITFICHSMSNSARSSVSSDILCCC